MDLTKTIKDTLDLRRFMLKSLEDVVNKRITPSDARARSWLGRVILDTLKIEMIAAREGLRHYAPVPLDAPVTIDGTAEEP